MVFSLAGEVPFAKEEVAVAIAHGALGSHAGIAFHSAKDGIQLLHLQFHQKLAVDTYPLSYCWITSPVAIPQLASKQLVGIVRAVAKRKPSINYGIDFIVAKGSFDANGHYKPPKGNKGLTCATFVSEIFRAASLPLIDEDTWEESSINIQWGNDVCGLLRKHKVSEDHIAEVKSTINGLRVRPEEIGAASKLPYKDRPVTYKVASSNADEVMSALYKHCPIAKENEAL